jgi:hypothetical protein
MVNRWVRLQEVKKFAACPASGFARWRSKNDRGLAASISLAETSDRSANQPSARSVQPCNVFPAKITEKTMRKGGHDYEERPDHLRIS